MYPSDHCTPSPLCQPALSPQQALSQCRTLVCVQHMFFHSDFFHLVSSISCVSAGITHKCLRMQNRWQIHIATSISCRFLHRTHILLLLRIPNLTNSCCRVACAWQYVLGNIPWLSTVFVPLHLAEAWPEPARAESDKDSPTTLTLTQPWSWRMVVGSREALAGLTVPKTPVQP